MGGGAGASQYWSSTQVGPHLDNTTASTERGIRLAWQTARPPSNPSTRGPHGDEGELIASIQSWIDTWNQEPRPFVWTKTADQILENITRYLQRTSNSGH